MAPAVYVRKKSGELRLCVDYQELNKRTHKDAYRLPLVDEVQDRLSGSVIFSKLDLQSGNWQVPVDCVDEEKTAFCPGPLLHCVPKGSVIRQRGCFIAKKGYCTSQCSLSTHHYSFRFGN